MNHWRILRTSARRAVVFIFAVMIIRYVCGIPLDVALVLLEFIGATAGFALWFTVRSKITESKRQ